MRRLAVLLSILYALPAHAEIIDFCTLPQLPKHDSCKQSPILYTEENASNNSVGSLLELSSKFRSEPDVSGTATSYVAIPIDQTKATTDSFTPAAIPLLIVDSPNSFAGAMCTMSKLGIDWNFARGLGEDKNFYGRVASYQRRGNKMYQVYMANEQSPFRGKLVVSEKACEGDYGYRDNIVTYAEAQTSCIDQFTKDNGANAEPTPLKPIYIFLSRDNFGYYYTCEFMKPKSEGCSYYRLDMNKTNQVPPALIKKSADCRPEQEYPIAP